jgi:hypothetical protein
MTQPPKPPTPALAMDPAKAWRDWFVQSERDWSEALTRLMQDENISRTVGQEITAGLHRQQMLTQGMAGNLAMMGMPTRDEVLALGERIGRLEDAVARVEAAMTRIASADTPRPARTRKAAEPAHESATGKPAARKTPTAARKPRGTAR